MKESKDMYLFQNDKVNKKYGFEVVQLVRKLFSETLVVVLDSMTTSKLRVELVLYSTDI